MKVHGDQLKFPRVKLYEGGLTMKENFYFIFFWIYFGA